MELVAHAGAALTRLFPLAATVAAALALTAGVAFAAKLVGTSGPDTIAGTEKRDRISAKAGDDTVDAKGGRDRVRAGAGNDRVEGGNGRDMLLGGKGDDTLSGGNRRDVILASLGAHRSRHRGCRRRAQADCRRSQRARR